MSASFAATERQPGHSGPRIVADTVTTTVKEAGRGLWSKIKSFFGFVAHQVRKVVTKVFSFIKPAIDKVASLIPAPVRRFVPALSMLPLAFSATWRVLGDALTFLWTRVLNKPWVWLMRQQVRLAAYAMTHKGTFKGFLANIGTYVAAWLPFAVPIAAVALAGFKVIGVLTAAVVITLASPANSALMIAGATLKPSVMAWIGRGGVVAVLAATFLGAPLNLVATVTAVFMFVALHVVGIIAGRENDEYTAAVYSPEQTANLIAEAEQTLTEANVVASAQAAREEQAEQAEQAKQDPKGDESEKKEEVPVGVNVVKSKLSKGYDRIKVPHVPEGMDINLSTVKDLRWKQGIAWAGDRPVACDLRPSLKASQRDGRRKAFSDAVVAYLERQHAA